jgi:hypothetical protein
VLCLAVIQCLENNIPKHTLSNNLEIVLLRKNRFILKDNQPCIFFNLCTKIYKIQEDISEIRLVKTFMENLLYVFYFSKQINTNQVNLKAQFGKKSGVKIQLCKFSSGCC